MKLYSNFRDKFIKEYFTDLLIEEKGVLSNEYVCKLRDSIFGKLSEAQSLIGQRFQVSHGETLSSDFVNRLYTNLEIEIKAIEGFSNYLDKLINEIEDKTSIEITKLININKLIKKDIDKIKQSIINEVSNSTFIPIDEKNLDLANTTAIFKNDSFIQGVNYSNGESAQIASRYFSMLDQDISISGDTVYSIKNESPLTAKLTINLTKKSEINRITFSKDPGEYTIKLYANIDGSQALILKDFKVEELSGSLIFDKINTDILIIEISTPIDKISIKNINIDGFDINDSSRIVTVDISTVPFSKVAIVSHGDIDNSSASIETSNGTVVNTKIYNSEIVKEGDMSKVVLVSYNTIQSTVDPTYSGRFSRNNVYPLNYDIPDIQYIPRYDYKIIREIEKESNSVTGGIYIPSDMPIHLDYNLYLNDISYVGDVVLPAGLYSFNYTKGITELRNLLSPIDIVIGTEINTIMFDNIDKNHYTINENKIFISTEDVSEKVLIVYNDYSQSDIDSLQNSLKVTVDLNGKDSKLNNLGVLIK